jgi:F-type H+-transporting ATPase subunit a
MKVWVFLNGVGKLFLGALLAFLCWIAVVNSPLWPRSAQASADLPQHEADHKAADSHDEHTAQEQRSGLTHVLDTEDWELFESFGIGHIHLPKILGLQITKFMVLEVIAALLVIAVYVPLARRTQAGTVPRGASDNFFEVLLTFVRDQVAKPALGEHDADRFVPFLWTMFLFILFNNLLGMVPLGGSPTASLWVTIGLALVVFGYMHGCGIAKMGLGRYVMSLWPHIDVPFPLGYFIKPLIFVLEWMGAIVRNAVLAVRLFANMFAGHMVLATILIFIWMARNSSLFMWTTVTVSSVAGIVALSLLELFIAFLQAFVFTFLTALFMGMALHPEH